MPPPVIVVKLPSGSPGTLYVFRRKEDFWGHVDSHYQSASEGWAPFFGEALERKLRAKDASAWRDFAEWLKPHAQSEFARPRVLEFECYVDAQNIGLHFLAVLKCSGAWMIVRDNTIVTVYRDDSVVQAGADAEERSVKLVRQKYCQRVTQHMAGGQNVESHVRRFLTPETWQLTDKSLGEPPKSDFAVLLENAVRNVGKHRTE